MNKVLVFGILIVLVFSSCAMTSQNEINYNYPQLGVVNNAVLAVKDYEPLGIIFVKSSESVDNIGNHTGSKITYEMLLLEAQKLQAHDVINIRIDVKKIENVIFDSGFYITKITHEYTATALAIRYTNAISVENINNNIQNIEGSMPIKEPTSIPSQSSTSRSNTQQGHWAMPR